jgi:hypothetical protein
VSDLQHDLADARSALEFMEGAMADEGRAPSATSPARQLAEGSRERLAQQLAAARDEAAQLRERLEQQAAALRAGAGAAADGDEFETGSHEQQHLDAVQQQLASLQLQLEAAHRAREAAEQLCSQVQQVAADQRAQHAADAAEWAEAERGLQHALGCAQQEADGLQQRLASAVAGAVQQRQAAGGQLRSSCGSSPGRGGAAGQALAGALPLPLPCVGSEGGWECVHDNPAFDAEHQLQLQQQQLQQQQVSAYCSACSDGPSPTPEAPAAAAGGGEHPWGAARVRDLEDTICSLRWVLGCGRSII